MATLTITIKAQIEASQVELKPFDVPFDGLTAVGPIQIEKGQHYTFSLNPLEKPPSMLLIMAARKDKANLEKGDLTFADKAPAINIPSSASETIKKVQTEEALRALTSIVRPTMFFNNSDAPLPFLDKIQQLIFWNNTDQTIELQIYRASTPGVVQ